MNLPNKSSQEWLQTNGLGGFACGVVSGPPTRRYHGLLCASLNPPTDRRLLVSHLIENIECCGEYYALSCEHYADHRPEPDLLPLEFNFWPYPTWEYLVMGNRLVKSILMLEGEDTTLVRYQNQGAQPITIHLKPLLALRDYHHLRPTCWGAESRLYGNTVWVDSGVTPPVYIASSHGTWRKKGVCYHRRFYAEEEARGFDAVEENWCPAELSVTIAPKSSLVIRLSLCEERPTEGPFLEQEKKDHNLVKKDLFKSQIESAAKSFIVDRTSTNGKTILAGYPWFTDWGRDTLIALRDFQDFLEPDEARGIIRTFLQYEKNGLIPNRFPDDSSDEVEYNTVDASLWLFVSAWELQQKYPSVTFLRRIFPALTRILHAHLHGTDFHIYVTKEGLLTGGEEGLALTWMDANVNGCVVTPRRGCAVEINALWYNALKIYQQFSKQLERQDLDVKDALKKFEKNFTKHFLNPQSQGLFDVVNPEIGVDEGVRPNQIYAISLPFSPLSKLQQKQVLKHVKEHLYTPLGLRTLSPADPDFRPYYQGDIWSRDTAYHQGAVWPFLLREYWVAHEKVYGKKDTKAALEIDIETLKNHFYEDAGLGSVSEVFDGELPASGKGCTAQAWSVAGLWRMVKMIER